ncbi:isoprenylcysteine carboxylmethyltransferase family protein [Candidatus Woesearchaeota archaeon]|nr:isoprenylcysteine carboxylmethyltransferase family protein [Candidatus Woesearchaeota archaeon]
MANKKNVKEKNVPVSSQVSEVKYRTMPVILVTQMIVAAVILTEFVVRLPPADAVFIIIGAASLLLGYSLRLIAHINLGKYFAYEVEIIEGHKLIQTGIHKYLRHPMYTGLFLMFVGVALALQSLIGLAVGTVLLVPVGIWRMRLEEKALLAEFGKEYEEYQKKSWKVVPFIW